MPLKEVTFFILHLYFRVLGGLSSLHYHILHSETAFIGRLIQEHISLCWLMGAVYAKTLRSSRSQVTMERNRRLWPVWRATANPRIVVEVDTTIYRVAYCI